MTSKTSTGQRIPFEQASRSLAQMVHDSARPPVVFLEGGHFNLRVGADTFSRASLDAAIDLGVALIRAYGRRIRIVFGILQDDLGIECGGGACAIDKPIPPEAAPTLPPELEATLAAHPIVKRNRVKIFRERAAKNRGITRLKRILATGSASFIFQVEQPNESQIFFQADDGERVQIARHNASRWVAGCPLVMAQHYADVASHIEERFSSPTPLLIIDYSQIQDQNKVLRGAELALRLFMSDSLGIRRIINVFFFDDEGQNARGILSDRADFESSPYAQKAEDHINRTHPL